MRQFCEECGERLATLTVKFTDESGVGSMAICEECLERSDSAHDDDDLGARWEPY